MMRTQHHQVERAKVELARKEEAKRATERETTARTEVTAEAREANKGPAAGCSIASQHRGGANTIAMCMQAAAPATAAARQVAGVDNLQSRSRVQMRCARCP